LLLVLCGSLIAGCSFPGSVPSTVKVGLSAPFEGLYRDLGYEALYAVRLAVQQRNDAGPLGGRYLVELVALNDFNESQEAMVQARKMGVDPDILGVLGGWSPQTARSAAAEYQRLGLAFLTPQAETAGWQESMPGDPAFIQNYQALSGGVPPGAVASWAYIAANRLLDAFEAAARLEGRPTRAGVSEILDPERQP
jgi:ABC-type branched-subunit amino acid transport system substrate-binding protein